MRDDKDPQMVINRVRSIDDEPSADEIPAAPDAARRNQTLYLKLPSAEGIQTRKALALLSMFPGKTRVVLYYADTGVRCAGSCAAADVMVQELRTILGEKQVVIQ